MSHFYGGVEGGASEATRTGSKRSGLRTRAQTYKTQVRVSYESRELDDFVNITVKDLADGSERTIFHGTEDGLLRLVEDARRAKARGDDAYGVEVKAR